jgi:two-component system OmpR family sensor kinase
LGVAGEIMHRERIKIDFLIHDLKVPLAVVETGISSLLQRREKYGPLSEKQETALMRALRNTKVIKSLVNDILELGRSREGIISTTTLSCSDLIEQVLIESFDLVDRTISEKIKICANLSQLRETLEERGLMLSIKEDLWFQDVCLDQAKTQQILRNLLNNALKYRKERVELEVEKKGVNLIFSVKDDGEGIPAMYHKKIFESYFQMDMTDSYTVRGHGLGLAGVMILVEDMGGELFLESDRGKGAKFLVRLPL